MANSKNIEIVGKLEEKLKGARLLVLADYRGLTHKQLEDLHRKLREVKAEFVVVKNSLLKIAASKTGHSLPPSQLTGPTAVLVSSADDFSGLKELYRFIKTTTFPKVKVSIFEGKEYDETETARIAALPNKEGLIAQLMYTLNANTQKVAYLLTQIKK